MCDPLSVSASILTVINVAAQSCEILYKAFHLFGGAGEDLNHYLSILESLKGTFAGIAKLEKDAGSPHVIPKSLKDRVEECGLHLRDIESLVRPSYEKFQQSKTDRLWIRIKWSTAYQTQKIERLMTRIESHYKALTLELLLLNTALVLRFNRKFLTYRETDRSFHLVKQKQNFFSRLPLPKLGLPTGDLRSPIANACRTRHSISRNTYSVQRRRRVGYVFPTVSRPPLSRIDDGERVGASKTFNDLDNRVHAVSSIFSSNTQTASEWLELDKSSSQTNAIVCFEGRIIPFLWWFGLIKSRRYLDYESPSLTEVTPQSGFMVGVAMTTHWCLAVRLELVMYFLMRLKGPSFNLSVNYSLKLPRVVPSNAESFKLVSHGDIKTMKVKLTAGEVSPFDVLSNGTSLLHLAAIENRLEMLRFLIQQGVSVNMMDDYGDTPLHRSLEFASDYDMSRILIENGADLNNRNVDGETPLHTTFSPSMEQILKNYDRLIDYSTLDSGGQTLLHHLACSNQTTGEIFEFINRRGNYAFTNLDGQGRSVLHLAASRGNVDVVHYILTQRSVDVNAQDGSGQTSLHHAVRSRRAPSTIELLISNGADHRIQDKTGRTALHSAALLGKEAAVKTLVNVIGANALYVEDHPTEIPMRIGKRNQVASVQNCLDGMIIGRESECHLSNQKVYCSFATPRLRTVTQDLPKGMQEESELIPYSWVYLSWCQARSSWRREEKTLRQLVKAVMFVLVLWAIWHLFA